MKKLRILFLIHKFVQGGAEQQLLELVKEIDKQKFEVTVGCFVPGGEKWDDFHTIADVNIVCFDRKHKLNFFVLRKILYFLREHPVDIIHAYMAPATVFGILAGLIARTPIRILGERGTKASFPSIGSRIYFILDNVLSRYADLIIANSEAGKRWRIKLGARPEHVMVIPNGLNPNRLHTKTGITKATIGIENSCPIIGTVAQLLPKKDHLTLLKAVEFVRKEYPNIKCLLIGDGPLREQLERYVKRANLHENIMFLGQQKYVRNFIEMFDIAALSSKDTEGCSNFILEAMSCGKPIVATNVGGNAELVVNGKTGFLVAKQEPQELATAILRFLKDEQLREKLGYAGRLLVEKNFLIERMVKRSEDVYRQLFLQKMNNS